jgi:hypothetical protein
MSRQGGFNNVRPNGAHKNTQRTPQIQHVRRIRAPPLRVRVLHLTPVHAIVSRRRLVEGKVGAIHDIFRRRTQWATVVVPTVLAETCDQFMMLE